MHRLMTSAAVALAFATGTAALAQPTFDARIAFGSGHGAAPTVITEPVVVSSAGTFAFTGMFGPFDAQGFTNYGLAGLIGSMSLSDPEDDAAISPRAGGGLRHPYAFGGVESNPSPTSIQFEANHAGISNVSLPWPPGEPQPFPSPLPAQAGGPDELFAGYMFQVAITDLTPRTITIDLAGPMQALTYTPTTLIPPDGDTPGSAEYAPGFVTAQGAGTLTIVVVPTPAAAALLGLGGLVAAGRRRVE